ncbi:cation-translocating P-type ATPase [Atopobium sp. oral taxon 416]|uniref:heavy metal translocating P-type ATPase n=1 Tax=Atopobium sp. oral taxon 416 TaxID=712157 RepID=UPI001BAD9618|nr:heavy metal translocating P-type ATPase [Atopobium sp. oral taxon 416]QUC03664.1 heavy metal translocating P-type ATPase [Atopobium sp. oral taxon 416]
MKRLILQHRIGLTAATGILIAVAFAARFVLTNEQAAAWLLLAASIAGGLPILIQALKALRVRVVSIDLLVTIAMLGAIAIQEYAESAVVAFLFLFGAWLEQRTLAKTRSAIKGLTQMAPETAYRLTDDGDFEEVDVDEVDVDDVLRVKTGGKVPVDGVVVEGSGLANEASITGEPLPAEKSPGSQVYAGTILKNGTIQLRAQKVGEDTTFGKIIELVEEAQDSKSEAERFIDRFSRYYTPAVLLIAALVWLVTRNVELAVTILVLGCPGALVIGVPVSNVAGIGNGARNGILFKGSNVITNFSHVDTILFDKTGTLTYGTPQVARTIPYVDDPTEAEVILASVEAESDHPLTRAIAGHYADVQRHKVGSTEAVRGEGIAAQVEGHQVLVGNERLLRRHSVVLDERAKSDLAGREAEGDSIVLLALDGSLALAVGIRDRTRDEVKDVLMVLRRLGVKNLVLLSGDNQGTVDLVARQLGLTEAHGGLLPEDKAEYVKRLQMQGQTVAFVGDGINDSPSLALADIGIAMGGGTDVAIETSDVVLTGSDFHRIPHALGLARATQQNMVQNISIALVTVAFLLVNLVASTWMNMAIGMFVHEGSILVVILNAMRLLGYGRDPKKSMALDRRQFPQPQSAR